MNLTDSQKHYIRSSFASMQDKDDLLLLLNKAKEFLYGENNTKKIKEIALQSLTYYANTTLDIPRYKTFKVRKKNGKERIISAPVRNLKLILRCLNLVLQCVFEKEMKKNEKFKGRYVMGFVPKRGIKENATLHTNKIYVYNLDLQDFFHQIELHRVKACLKLPPFKLDKQREPLAFLIANLCCEKIQKEKISEKGKKIQLQNAVLPQGAPTSPILSNIVCQQLDSRLNGLAKRFSCTYTRYADDITFSSQHNVYQEDSEFIKELNRIIKDQNFTINSEKTRLQKSGYKQEVTGLIVNEKVNVNQHYIKNLRTIIHNWEKMGKEDAEQIFRQNYKNDKGHIQKGTPSMQQVVEGKLNFLRMVRGGEDATYKKLWERFLILVPNRHNNASKYEIPIYTPHLPHNPLSTTRLLRNFKFDNDTGLKDLVHYPIDNENFNLLAVWEKVSNIPIVRHIYSYNKTTDDKLLFAQAINSRAYIAFKDFLEKIKMIGIPFFKNERKHPLENLELKQDIQRFKTQYRFGAGKDEYTDFAQMFNMIFDELAKKNNYELDSKRIVFLPDEKKFKLRANFFTFVPCVNSLIRFIVEGIIQHENNEGEQTRLNSNISLEFVRQREEDKTVIRFRIEHQNSYCLISKEHLYRDIRSRTQLINNAWSICDWQIEAYFPNEEKNYRVSLVPNTIENAFELLKEKPTGFTHILTFYDI